MLRVHITKALIIVSLLALAFLFTFNQIIKDNRLAIFHQYSLVRLPAQYKIIKNSAKDDRYKTSVWLIFQFDGKNYNELLRLNYVTAPKQLIPGKAKNYWQAKPNAYTSKRSIKNNKEIRLVIDKKSRSLEFEFTEQ